MELNGSATKDQKLVADAEAALSGGQWAVAAAAYEELVRARPDEVELKYRLARAYEGPRQFQSVIELLASHLQPDSRR